MCARSKWHHDARGSLSMLGGSQLRPSVASEAPCSLPRLRRTYVIRETGRAYGASVQLLVLLFGPLGVPGAAFSPPSRCQPSSPRWTLRDPTRSWGRRLSDRPSNRSIHGSRCHRAHSCAGSKGRGVQYSSPVVSTTWPLRPDLTIDGNNNIEIRA